MKQLRATTIIFALLLSPLASAEGTYVGGMLGQILVDDATNSSLGLVVGTGIDGDFGVEGFYSASVSDDSVSRGPVDADVSTNAYGLLATYRLGNEVYVKLKAGLAGADIDVDAGDFGSGDESASGLAVGFSAGAQLGPGELELYYVRLPEFDDIDGRSDLLSLAYLWYF